MPGIEKGTNIENIIAEIKLAMYTSGNNIENSYNLKSHNVLSVKSVRPITWFMCI